MADRDDLADMVKARRRVNLEPEWRFRRPVAVNVDAHDRIFVLESARPPSPGLQQGKGLRGTPHQLVVLAGVTAARTIYPGLVLDGSCSPSTAPPIPSRELRVSGTVGMGSSQQAPLLPGGSFPPRHLRPRRGPLYGRLRPVFPGAVMGSTMGVALAARSARVVCFRWKVEFRVGHHVFVPVSLSGRAGDVKAPFQIVEPYLLAAGLARYSSLGGDVDGAVLLQGLLDGCIHNLPPAIRLL